ncbi:hypothetical protein Hanom_Chr04g00334131 [Helianthus anomalus]
MWTTSSYSCYQILHIVAPILDVVTLVVIPPDDWPFDDLFDDDVDLFVDGPPANAQGDKEIDDDVVVVPPPAIPVIELSFDSSLHSASDSFESVTSSALRAVGLQLYATDYDDDTAMSAAPSPSRVPTPPHDPEPTPELAFVPFGHPCTPSGEGTSGQPPRYDPFALAAFPPIPPTTFFTPFSSTPLDKPFRWFPPYTMPISDPYHPSHFVGYTRDELFLSLQVQFEILSRRVMELELTPPCSPPSSFVPPPAASVPPHSSTSPFAHPPAALAPVKGFDVRFLTVEQQISYLLRRVYELEEECAHVRNLLCFPTLPPPSVQ